VANVLTYSSLIPVKAAGLASKTVNWTTSSSVAPPAWRIAVQLRNACRVYSWIDEAAICPVDTSIPTVPDSRPHTLAVQQRSRHLVRGDDLALHPPTISPSAGSSCLVRLATAHADPMHRSVSRLRPPASRTRERFCSRQETDKMLLRSTERTRTSNIDIDSISPGHIVSAGVTSGRGFRHP
jgi:hypothetical protein